MAPTTWYYVLATVLFGLGVIGVVCRRQVIIILMCIDLMLNGANLLFVAIARDLGNIDGQVIVFFVLAVAAAEAAVGLAIIVKLFESRGTIDADEINLMKW